MDPQRVSVSGILTRGYGVAGRPSQDYPYGSLERQIPIFKSRGLDLERFYRGTLNIDIHPFVFELLHPEFTFRDVSWTDLHPPEDFSFSRCQVAFAGVEYDGWIYYHFNRSFSEIHAPANGYVLRKFVNAGQVVSAGDPILLTNAAVENNWILKIGVSDKQWASIKINDKAAVEIDAFPDRSFQAAVSRKAERSDPMTGAFTVELLVRNEGVRLATGMFGAARLESRATVTTWSVPYEAVLDANGNEGFVFVTNDNKVAVKQPVLIETFNGKTTGS